MPELDRRRAFPILDGLPDRDLAALPLVRVERDTGERFFDEGDPCDAVYGVIDGRVRIAKHALSGRELTLDVFGPGDLVAAVAVFRKIPMPASAFAVEPTACARIEAEAFRRILIAHPQVVARVLDLMSRRLVDAGQARLRLATEPVECRLAAAILRMASKFAVRHEGEWIFERDFTRQQLADIAGTTVESTIRVLSRWTKEGLLSTRGQRLRIHRPGALERLAGD